MRVEIFIKSWAGGGGRGDRVGVLGIYFFRASFFVVWFIFSFYLGFSSLFRIVIVIGRG